MMMAIKFFIILYFKDNDVTFNIICYPTSHANLRSKWGMKRNPRFITSLSFYMPRSDLTYSWWTLLFTVIQLKSQVSSPDRKLGEDKVNWLFFFSASWDNDEPILPLKGAEDYTGPDGVLETTILNTTTLQYILNSLFQELYKQQNKMILHLFRC